MKAILLDDEPLSLAGMERLLRRYGVDVRGSYVDPLAALREAPALGADVAFVDIELPGMSGLAAAERLQAACPALRIVFVTAYDQYAVDAFELNASDYLIKPVQPRRLEKTLERLAGGRETSAGAAMTGATAAGAGAAGAAIAGAGAAEGNGGGVAGETVAGLSPGPASGAAPEADLRARAAQAPGVAPADGGGPADAPHAPDGSAFAPAAPSGGAPPAPDGASYETPPPGGELAPAAPFGASLEPSAAALSASRPAAASSPTPAPRRKLLCFRRLSLMEADGRVVELPWRTAKAKEVFAYMLHSRNSFVPKDAIIDLVWPEMDLGKAQTLLHTTMYQIRQTIKSVALGIRLRYADGGYRLELDDVAVDVDEWEGTAPRTESEDEHFVQELRAWSAAYRGDYFEMEGFLWAEQARERLRMKWLDVALRCAERLGAAGQWHSDAFALGAEMVRRFPLVPEGYLLLMRTYHRQGQSAEVRKVYAQYRTASEEEGESRPPGDSVSRWMEAQYGEG